MQDYLYTHPHVLLKSIHIFCFKTCPSQVQVNKRSSPPPHPVQFGFGEIPI